jgi:hypothetical protein
VILFPQAYRRFGHLIRSYGPYLVRGRVEQNHRAIGITADWLDEMKTSNPSPLDGPLSSC